MSNASASARNQFSLRTLIVLQTAICLLLGVYWWSGSPAFLGALTIALPLFSVGIVFVEVVLLFAIKDRRHMIGDALARGIAYGIGLTTYLSILGLLADVTETEVAGIKTETSWAILGAAGGFFLGMFYSVIYLVNCSMRSPEANTR